MANSKDIHTNLDNEKLNILLNSYQLLRNNLEAYESRQWKIVYYCVAVNAALILVSLKGLTAEENAICVVATLSILVCTIVIKKLEDSINNCKDSVSKIYGSIPLLKSVALPQREFSSVKKIIENDISVFKTENEPIDICRYNIPGKCTDCICFCFLAISAMWLSYFFLLFVLYFAEISS